MYLGDWRLGVCITLNLTITNETKGIRMGSDPVSLHVAGEDAMCLAAYVRFYLYILYMYCKFCARHLGCY